MALVPRWRLPLWFRIAWTIGLSLLAAATGAVQVLDRKLKPDTWEWIHEPGLLIGLVVALSATTFLDTTKRAINRAGMPRLERRSVGIRKQLGSLIVSVAEVTERDISHIGAGLWVVQKRGIVRPRRLFRVERVRLVDVMRESNVQFVKGKGTVGTCWQNERTEHTDWRAINDAYDADLPTEEAWRDLGQGIQRGFTLKDFKTLVGKYSEVIAEPIMVNKRFVGCLSLDLKWNKESTSDRCLLNEETVKTQLAGAAITIVPVISK